MYRRVAEEERVGGNVPSYAVRKQTKLWGWLDKERRAAERKKTRFEVAQKARGNLRHERGDGMYQLQILIFPNSEMGELPGGNKIPGVARGVSGRQV